MKIFTSIFLIQSLLLFGFLVYKVQGEVLCQMESKNSSYQQMRILLYQNEDSKIYSYRNCEKKFSVQLKNQKILIAKGRKNEIYEILPIYPR